ncbi:glutaminase A [Microbacterium koreense]|uniref:Glutaminase n=1 Tax=Microbacterium koreense TaxID=323761 RepID=A0ABW2ZNL4_9MICO
MAPRDEARDHHAMDPARLSPQPVSPAHSQPLRTALTSVLTHARSLTDGEVASYIPELARQDPEQLGIALASVRGTIHAWGDSEAEFTIQSISKPFTFALALDALGLAAVTEHVGLEPSGEPFNAISLEETSGRPLNPMINAGAIVTTSLIAGDDDAEKFAVVRDGLSAFAGRRLDVDEDVYLSELDTGDRNRALAYLAQAAGTLASSAEVATRAYFRQCSLRVNARDLAMMAATLAGGGINPLTRERVVSEDVARWTIAVMTSCGMYDASGDWLVRVGLPAKSGVGGGIVALQPDQFGVGTFSPRLDARGNSVRGVGMLEQLSKEFGLHMLEHRADPLSPIADITHSGPDDDRDTTAVLRGDFKFSDSEQVLSMLPELMVGRSLTLDFSSVTRVGPSAARIFRGAAERAGSAPDGRPRLALHDPDHVLGD